MKKIRRRHRRYNNFMWFYSVIACICLLTMGVGYAILSARNNIQIDVTKTKYGADDKIIDLLGNNISVTTGSGTLEKIEQPATEQTSAQTEYRYRGKNPNNYVTFNNELWRIIGIVDGKVKLIRNESIGNYSWHEPNYIEMNSDNVVENKISNNLYDNIVAIPMAPEIVEPIGKGFNNWLKASLNKYLNGDYYNSLTSEAQSMIEESIWYLGGWNTSEIKTNVMYEKERGTTVYDSSRSTKTIDKIALMYPSDYGYGAEEGCSDSNKLGNYNNIACTSNNWIFNSIDEWTLTPNSSSELYVFYVNSGGYVVASANAYSYRGVRPVLYLKGNVQITGGTGEKNSPYTLSVN